MMVSKREKKYLLLKLVATNNKGNIKPQENLIHGKTSGKKTTTTTRYQPTIHRRYASAPKIK